MLAAVIALQIAILLLLIVVLVRRGSHSAPDPKQAALLAADLQAQMARADERTQGMERLLRAEMGQLRQESGAASARLHESADGRADVLRVEMARSLQQAAENLRSGLDGLRGEHRTEAERLRGVLDGHLALLSRRFADFSQETARLHGDHREALHLRLHEMARSQGETQERLRGTVEQRLDKLNEANTLKLEEMRQTVDEKLHATLQSRLTESFGAVTDQLTKVHSGLGEMAKLSAGVDDLSRIFTNVKSRGGFAEVQLGMLLGQMLAPNQFRQNVKVKPNTGEMVEYTVLLPSPQGELLLPIDAKFPREAWERLETAHQGGSTAAEVALATRAFEAAIRTEAKRICDKYIAPPVTTNFAIMFLPTEGLYAEVMRRDGLQAELQQNHCITIAGPSTLSALLSSFQMGFHMLHLQRKGDEVWKVLASARKEFGTFETLMGTMERQVNTVQNTIEKLNTRTRVINRTLREVSLDDAGSDLPGSVQGVQGADGKWLPVLAAAEDQQERIGNNSQ